MNIFQDLLTSTWAFLQAYGWITVFITILAYVIYNKYIYDFLNTREENRKLIEQKKFDCQVQDKEQERIRLARERQQEDHDRKEKEARIKREVKEKEDAEKRLRELKEQDTTCNVLGHASSAHSPIISGLNSTDRKNQHAIDIVESLPGTCDVTVFGYSTCPNFRKVCQLISTYRLDVSHFQVFEFDKQKDWPMEKVFELIKSRFGEKLAPYVFVCGEFIGGLEEARTFDRNHGFSQFK
ncbi:hypothetical protein GCK72_009986 [Caenorhabditis remanei]|uniref:Uncharacterized protein n=1 Tax=Caenorhabditis remanei TaxID=31234 RepID=A0A6A5H1P9_CAERE|nr:hypothetical protein GCK72_009986 [Caenorhabditis remanei]KAF1761730.1 hypothetical protein GCK72_009986 [Caenorhabditis remanei]